MRLGSLCTGYGGLDLAVEALLPTETVWLSEIDKNASLICEARFPGVPNLGDLTAIDWSHVEPVDVLTAGYPCQPFSHAGKRQGTNDARHIWPFILDALRVLRPRLALFENVAGHLSLGFDAVLADLASVGFDAEWCVVRASDVGACHRRQRLFIAAADTERVGQPGRREARDVVRPSGCSLGEGVQRQRDRYAADDRRAAAADADSSGREARCERPGTGDSRRLQPLDSCFPVAPHDDGTGVEGLRRSGTGRRQQPLRGRESWGVYAAAVARHAALAGRVAPAPTDERGRLSAAFVEWMMCLPEGWVTDILPRNPALKALGNGVVPPQAAYAISHLLERHEASEAAA